MEAVEPAHELRTVRSLPLRRSPATLGAPGRSPIYVQETLYLLPGSSERHRFYRFAWSNTGLRSTPALPGVLIAVSTFGKRHMLIPIRA
jgi:hypothetical protein